MGELAARCGPRGRGARGRSRGPGRPPAPGRRAPRRGGWRRGRPTRLAFGSCCSGLPVELQHELVAAPDDQQRGRADPGEPGAREVGPAAPRHHGRHPQPRVRRRAQSAAAAPVLAPKRPSGRARQPGCALQPLGRPRRGARPGSRCRTPGPGRAPPSRVSRSRSRVPSPASRSTRATRRLRGLSRLLPLPWAKATRPRGRAGTSRMRLERPVGAGHRDVHLARRAAAQAAAVQAGTAPPRRRPGRSPGRPAPPPRTGGLVQADQVVDVPGQAAAGLAGRHRHGQDHGARPVGARDLAGGPGGGAGGHAVVDHDGDPVQQGPPRTGRAQPAYPVVELGAAVLLQRVQRVARQPGAARPRRGSPRGRRPRRPPRRRARAGSGTPSLRTRITSRGACSARATSKATGTPPRGSPRTTGSASR